MYGVGQGRDESDIARAQEMADERARLDLARVFMDDMVSPSGETLLPKNLMESLYEALSKHAPIVDHFVAPGGTVYALAELEQGPAGVAKVMALKGPTDGQPDADGAAVAGMAGGLAGLAAAQPAAEPKTETKSMFETRPPPQPKPEARPKAQTKPKPQPAARAPSGGGHQPILAVFSIESKRKFVKEQQVFLDSLTDYLCMRLAESDKFQVVPRSELKRRLVESKRDTHKECYDQSCQIELGKELAAEMTLASQVVKLGSRCRVTLGLYDLKRAATEDAATVKAKGCSEDDLAEALDEAVRKLTNKR